MERDDCGGVACHDPAFMMSDICCLGQLQLPPAFMFVDMRAPVRLVKYVCLVGSKIINPDFVLC